MRQHDEVGRPAVRASTLPAGHCAGACAPAPGALSYFQSTARPVAAAPSHTAVAIQSHGFRPVVEPACEGFPFSKDT